MPTALERYQSALELVLQFEGGKVDDPEDRGGRTAFGITQRTYDAWCTAHHLASGDVWEITRSEIATIYRTEYWDRVAGDCLQEQSWKLAACVFDGAVNHGVGISARFLQRTVDAFPDGVIGDQTLARLGACLTSEGEAALLQDYLGRRRQLYQNLIRNVPAQARFRAGWRARLNKLAEFVNIDPVWEDY